VLEVSIASKELPKERS